MNNKFRKATKRIAAVAASAAVVSSSVFAAGLSNYPTSFVEDGKFNGQVVIGSGSGADDANAAASLIDDLKAEFSGDANKVKISYKKSGTGGESVSVGDSGKELNFGEDLNDVQTSAFDNGDANVLEDESLKLGSTREDYEQSITLDNNGEFEHALRDDLDSKIGTHIFFSKGNILSYELELDSSINVSSMTDDDIVGQKITIMGNEFTIGDDYSKSGSAFSKLKLIGGANKVSLGEGESSTVTVNGKSYEIAVQSVSSTKVLLTVNGESISIDEYESETVAGVSVAVTDLVSSSRDAVKGYAELVVGGQEVLLEHGKEIKINDEKISDLHEDYQVTAYFNINGATTQATSFTGLTLQYAWDNSDGMMLKAGDSFEDKVFQAFRLEFEGTNDVEYSTVTVESTGEKVKLSGETIDGDSFSEEIAYILDKTSATSPVRLIGSDNDVPLLTEDVTITNLDVYNTSDAKHAGAIVAGNTYYVRDQATASLIAFIGTGTEVNALFNSSAGDVSGMYSAKADDGVRFLTGDADNQKLYEVTGYSESDDEFDFEDVLSGSAKSDVKDSDVTSKLDDVTFTASSDEITVITNTDSNTALAFEDELLADLSDVTNMLVNNSQISFSYDSGDLTEDTTGDAASIDVIFGQYDTTDDQFTFSLNSSNFVSNSGAEADVAENDDDTEEYVNAYGTKVVYDAEDKQKVEIMTPNKQVEAKVSLVFGGVAASEMTTIVDSADVESKKDELKEAGYTIVGTEDVESESVEFDVTSPVTDSEAGSENLIVVGGPAVNSKAVDLLGSSEFGVVAGEALIRYFEASNSIVVYGYSKADTEAAVEKLNAGGLSGNEERFNN